MKLNYGLDRLKMADKLNRSWFQTMSVVKDHAQFLQNVVDIILKDVIFEGCDRQNPVLRFRYPEHLKEILHLEPTDKPASQHELLQAIKDTIKFSVKTGHPHFINQLFSGMDSYGLAGQWTSDALNSSVYTYEVAPVFTLMEAVVLKEMRKLVGWEEHGDGIFCPGGSLCNGTAINLARYHYNPQIKADGVSCAGHLVLFASADAHYSNTKMASLLGLGSANVIPIDVDSTGRMRVDLLELAINKALGENAIPFLVIATAGTTVLGAIDPLPEIAGICDMYKLWLHVDAAWGGGLLFSSTHKELLKGINLADSVTWNPHKLLCVPQQCSVLLTRHTGIFSKAYSSHASYLFQQDKFYDTQYDVGDKHFQCGRKADVFKFWLMWKAKGSSGFERHVDSVLSCAKYMVDSIKKRPCFRLVSEPQFINVCFWFIPSSLMNLENSPTSKILLHQVAPKLKERMMVRGSMMIGYQPLRDWPNFFRFVVQSSAVTKEDCDFFLNEIENLGSDL